MISDVIDYMVDLDATSDPCVQWGTTFKFTGSSRNLFGFVLPDTPDNAVCINPYGGAEPTASHKDILNPNFQVWIRNKEPKKSYELAIALIKEFHKNNQIVKGVCFALSSSPVPVGLDTKGRQSFTINFTLKWVIT